MRRLSLVVTLPILIVAVVFSVTNRHAVPVRLWPLRLEVDLPLFLLVLAALALGMLAGALAAWLAAGRARGRARREHRRAELAEAELRRLRQAAKTESQPAAAPPALRLAGKQR